MPDCPECGMVWSDTCEPFETNNETAYNEQLTAAFSSVSANVTPVPDLSNQSWTDAFLTVHNLLKERYAFSSRKAVDWDRLYNTYSPKIVDAEARNDSASYYRTIREYLFSIPDGHINVLSENGDFGARYTDIGGGYGITVNLLDSGKCIISYVAHGSEAEKKGLKPGDVVTAWNGKEIHDAINETPYIWATKKPSTSEGIFLHQQRFLTRGPVGSQVTISVISPEKGSETIHLTGYDDRYDTVNRSSFFLGKNINDYGIENTLFDIKPQISNDSVTVRTLPGGYTYIALYEESYDVYQPFKSAMVSAMSNNTPGIVLDLRFNGGGDDNLASCIAGWFAKEPVFYEFATTYDPGLHNDTIISAACTKPRPRIYEGPVVVMVSPDTISSGEGVPMVMNKTARGKIISWYGTDGAFGMVTAAAILPLDLEILYPDGASLDENKKIQVDSDSTGIGGIAPHVRVPMNEDTITRGMAGEDVQLMYALKYLEDNKN
ncbi:S41 family peptidase [Methanospirillum lacunae]|uniref:Peptidase S41 n=2 Tax=Methanospirillum lacunae TaxID=668570 RepID=A0A2V2MY71_9EURY|nr:peptidase S41 [Methanospirillum lacunae]